MPAVTIPKPCVLDEARRAARAQELKTIADADQKDREHWLQLTPAQLGEVAQRDLIRRKRVGEIFGEGCLTRAEDYAAAAIVFQHGDSPDHYYQTFVWSQRAVALGDASQKTMLAFGLDRYLSYTGYKQLFASQASAKQARGCYCLDPVERSFPDRLRLEYTGRDLKGAFAMVDQMNAGRHCPPAKECAVEAKPSPAGSVPGFW